MGGYKIINLKGIDLIAGSGIGEKVEGVYEAIESTKKPILITNLYIDAIDVKDTFVLFSSVQGAWHGHINLEDNDITIAISNDDIVQILA